MNGLEQVKRAVKDALVKNGVRAEAAYPPDWAKNYDAPVVAVGIRTGESKSGAMCHYLGSRVDPVSRECKEVYGLRLDLTLSLDIYSPAGSGAAGCDQALEKLHQVMLEGLPTGLKPSELKWEETVWDRDSSMFLRRGSLACGAFFTAAGDEDGAPLSDFILKGVVTE